MALQLAESFSGTGIRHDLLDTDNLYVGIGINAVSNDDTAIVGSGTLRSIQINGSVFGAIFGISISASGAVAGDNLVTIGKTGQVTAASTAIRLTGVGNAVLNYGEISSFEGIGVQFANGGNAIGSSKLINYGSILSSSEAVSTGSDPILIRNYGEITSLFTAAITTGAGNDTLQNFGNINGNVDLSFGNNLLINRGLIAGDIDSSGGNDKIDNRIGTIMGEIRLGDGFDTYMPGASDETVDGGLSFDKLDFTRSSGVQIALDDSIAATGWATGDTYINFEDLLGSLTGADVLIGNANSNSLLSYGGNDTLSGLAGADTLDGGLGNDTLDGGADADYLYGGTGNDVLIGGDGADVLNGQAGNDKLRGGAGKDNLGGGLGADTFIFAKGEFGGLTTPTAEVIADFTQAEADQIDLALVDASTKLIGDQAFAFIGTAAFSKVAGQLRFEQSAGATYIQGDTNGDSVADFWIGLSGLITLKAADFIL